MTRAEAEQWAEDSGVELVFYDGFDAAILGIGQRFNAHFVVYDYERVLKTLRRDMSKEDALEHFDFNVVGGWVGEQTPCFLTRRL